MKKIKKISLISVIILLSLYSCKQDNISPNLTRELQSTIHSVHGDTIVHKMEIDENDIYINEIKGKFYFADDIILSDHQFNTLKMSAKGVSTNPRSFVTSSFLQTWPNSTVYYALPDRTTMTDEYYQLFLSSIQEAFNKISSKTNVKFVQRTTQAEYIRFIWANVNSSPLGYEKGRVNEVKISSIFSSVIVAHEIMHSLGVMHEQCRPDRDQYVKVITSNIDQTMMINYNIMPGYKSVGVFDYMSCMLYGSYDLCIDPYKPSMLKINGEELTKNRSYITETDYLGINTLYPKGISFAVLPYPSNSVGWVVDNKNYNVLSYIDQSKGIYVQGKKAVNGAKLGVTTSVGTDVSQSFLLRSFKEGSSFKYVLKSALDTTKVLTVPGNSSVVGTELTLEPFSQAPGQYFYVIYMGDNKFQIHCKHNLNRRIVVKNIGDAASSRITMEERPMIVEPEGASQEAYFHFVPVN